MARTAGSVLLRLSDSLFLPLNISDYSETLHSFLQAAENLRVLLEQHGISLGTETPISRHGEPYAPRAKMLAVLPQDLW